MPKQILRSHSARLAELVKHSRSLQKLEKIILPLLDPALQNQVRLASFAQGCVKFVVPSGMWATKLRYTFPDLMHKLKALPQFSQISRLEVSIVPDNSRESAPLPPATPMPASVSQSLEDLAEFTRDESLKASLRRLAKNPNKTL